MERVGRPQSGHARWREYQRMTTSTAVTRAAGEDASAYDAAAEVHETHTGVVVLIGNKAYKVKKPVVTDFLDFSTPERRERACAREVILNCRMARDSYLGIAHLDDPTQEMPEPVIVMRRYPDR